MKTLIVTIWLLLGAIAYALPPQVVYNPFDTNAIAAPPADGYFIVSLHGKPIWGLGGTNGTVIQVTTVTTTYLITTNVIIQQPGGFQNLNLTPNSVMKSDGSDFETSIQNGFGVLTNGGLGIGDIGWSRTLSLDLINVIVANLTNVFLYQTNVPVLATDGNGQLISGAPLRATNVLLHAGANINFSTDANGGITISASGVLSSQYYASNAISGGTFPASTIGAFSGDLTSPGGSYVLTLNSVNGNIGTFGDATHVPQITVNAKGLVTGVVPVAITGTPPGGAAGGVLSGTYPNPGFSELVVTQGMTAQVTVSNQFQVDATHAFVASNATASAIASFDSAHNLTNAMLAARFTLTGNLLDIAAGSIPNADLANSTITVTDGAGIGIGGSPVALGGTLTGSAITATPQFAGMNLTGKASGPTFQPNTNAMASATNTLDFLKSDYTFVSPTAMQITGFLNLPTTNSGNIVLTLVNTAGTNWNLTIPTSVLTPTGVRGTITVTNGQDRVVWFRYNPGSGHTNECDQPNF